MDDDQLRAWARLVPGGPVSKGIMRLLGEKRALRDRVRDLEGTLEERDRCVQSLIQQRKERREETA